MNTKKYLKFLVLWLVVFVAFPFSSFAQTPVEFKPSTPIPVPIPGIPQPIPTPIDVECPIGCNCDSQGKVLYCEVIPIPVPQPIPPTVPQPTPEPVPVPQTTPTPVPVPLPTDVQWSTSAPIKIEVTATETAISASRPTTSKLPTNCIKEGETITCPTSEAKQIVVPVTGSTSGPLEAVTIQKQTSGTIGITSHEVTAVIAEKITVENGKLFVGTIEGAKPVSVLPNEAQNAAVTSAGITSVATTELKTEEQRPVYTVQGIREAKLLFFIPVSVQTTVKIDATSGEKVSIQKPWWSFLAF